ncbi:hypothetical protein JCM10212_003622 [Sporobolomyces blumeae]
MAQGFNPSSGIAWTARTAPAKMNHLVGRREEVFEIQRQYGHCSDARAASTRHLAQVFADRHRERCQLDRYVEFCTKLAIPAFPISIELAALFLFAKCSWLEENYYSTVSYLGTAARETYDIWFAPDGTARRKDVPSYDFAAQELADLAVKEFLQERQNVRVRNKASGRQQRVTPNLPKLGDRFNDFDELFSSVYRSALGVYGMGIRTSTAGVPPFLCARSHVKTYGDSRDGVCPWQFSFRLDPVTKEIAVDKAKSFLFHNHGPHPKLIKDPLWRPLIKHPRVRRDLRLDPLLVSEQVGHLGMGFSDD